MTNFARKNNDNHLSMQFRTEVTLPESHFTICHDDVLLTVGSCFADHMGCRLEGAGFCCDVNPLGTQYNPSSVALVVERMLDSTPFKADDLHNYPGEGWGSWMHHSRFSRSTPDEALHEMNSRLLRASDRLHGGCVLILTFGSAWVYRLFDDHRVVGNCHRCPESLFQRSLLSVDEVITLWQPLLERLASLPLAPRIVFTISPIRHLRDGAHGNRLSKAVLLLSVEALQKTYAQLTGTDHVAYFPAYELLLDELRDYRFYADDMTHPSALAEEYIWDRFSTMFFTDATRTLISRWDDVKRALGHHPFRPESDEYRQFIRQTLLKIEAIQKDFPNFVADNEIQQCHTLLNNWPL